MLYDPKWTAKEVQLSDAQIYATAADLIKEHGHSKGQLRDANGRMCLWGAIARATDGNALSCSNRSYQLVHQLRPFINNKHPVFWNNAPSTTRRQVLSVLRRAARSAQTSERR